MTPQEKAEYLIKEFMPYQDDYYNDEPRDGAISCALIAVDECIELLLNISPHMAFPQQVEYWQEIKHELDKL
jgi:hypothetical protein